MRCQTARVMLAHAALMRAEEARRRCRLTAPKQHSKAWKEYYVHRYEWHQAWLDYGRQVVRERHSIEARQSDA